LFRVIVAGTLRPLQPQKVTCPIISYVHVKTLLRSRCAQHLLCPLDFRRYGYVGAMIQVWVSLAVARVCVLISFVQALCFSLLVDTGKNPSFSEEDYTTLHISYHSSCFLVAAVGLGSRFLGTTSNRNCEQKFLLSNTSDITNGVKRVRDFLG